MNNPSIDYLNNRLSLRTPQLEALKVLDDISDFVLDDNICLRKLMNNQV